MTYKTYDQLLSEINFELDLGGETFVDPNEMMDYVNKAVNEAAAHIHKLNAADHYFETYAPLTLVQNQAEYSLPTDIYGDKVKKVVYSENQSRIFEINRMKREHRHVDSAVIDTNLGSTVLYQYMLINRSPEEGTKLHLYPTAQINGPYVTIWYIREPKKVTDGTSLVDVPEFYYFITQYVKWKVYSKETHPNTTMEYQELERVRALMIQTLEDRVPDEDNKIEMDLSFYEEMV